MAKAKGEQKTKKPAPAVILNDGNGTAAASGRPSKYVPEYAGIARKMCELGAIDADIADALGVSTSTISNWTATYPEFCDALQVGKGEFDARIVRSLAQRAAGYSHDAVKIFMPAGATEPVYASYREHVPPDVNAAKLWLTNRRRDEWADTSRHEVSGRDGSPIVVENASSREIARAVLDMLREAHLPETPDPDETDGQHDDAPSPNEAAAGFSGFPVSASDGLVPHRQPATAPAGNSVLSAGAGSSPRIRCYNAESGRLE